MDQDIRQFGTLSDGRRVDAITLRAGAAQATVLTWGAVLQDMRLAGVGHSLTLGSDRLADYEGAMRHHGSLIGPVVNRLSGAKAVVQGRELRFEANHEGRITLHSGAAGTHLKRWDVAAAGADFVLLGLQLADGEGGFPGRRSVAARFTLAAPATLRLEVTAVTDAVTLLNFANHSYWNLDGGPDWSGHQVRVAAERYLRTTVDFTPTGEISKVEGAAVDFRQMTGIAPGRPALDTCFCLAEARRELTDVVWLRGRSGVHMVVATTEPGVQVYDGRAARRPGRGAYEGIAVEAQGWPDAPNHAGFPSIALQPGETCRQVTEWRFGSG